MTDDDIQTPLTKKTRNRYVVWVGRNESTMADATLHLTGELLLQLIPPIDHIVERARDSSPPRRARAGREGRQFACLLSTRSEARRDMAEASRALPGRLADSEQAMDPEALAQARALHASLAQTFALDGQSPLEGTTAARLCEEHRVHDRAVRALIERLPQGSTMGCEWRHVLEAIRGRLDHLVAAALARPPLGGDWHWPTGEARSARAATGCLDASETLRYNIAAMVGLLRRRADLNSAPSLLSSPPHTPPVQIGGSHRS